MIIQIADNVLDDVKWHAFLDIVVELVQQEESRLTFLPSEISKYIDSRWLRGASGSRGSIAQVLRSSLRVGSRSQISDAVTLRIDARSARSGETVMPGLISVHPLGSLAFLALPFHLVVEDETSDGGFVLWMARFTGRDEVIRAYRAGRFIFRHAGGKGQFPKSSAALSHGVWSREGREMAAMKLRCAAMLDGDARFPDDAPNKGIADETSKHVAFVKILAGRTIENYVPLKYFRRRLQGDGLGNLADDLFRLSEAERNYFAIKTGYKTAPPAPRGQTHPEFMADERRPGAERAHFAGVDEALWGRLSDGFGERLASVFMKPAYRCEPGERRGLTTTQFDEVDGLLTDLIRHL